jgi:hypothetical protein
MAISLTELQDQFEIEQALKHYSYGLDQRKWEYWQTAFTDDAIIDFSTFGGDKGPPSFFQAKFSAGDAQRLSGQHLLANALISVSGDEATAHTEFTVENARLTDDPKLISRVSMGGVYQDLLRRTEAGWRIYLRVGHLKWKESRLVADEVTR